MAPPETTWAAPAGRSSAPAWAVEPSARPTRLGLVILAALALATGLVAMVLSPFVVAEMVGGGSSNGFVFAAKVVLASIGGLLMLRLWFIQLFALFAHLRLPEPPARNRGAPWPFVSILVPAFEEEETIVATLRSLIGLDYPSFEIIVVDDGSRDRTLALAQTFAGRHARCTVRVFTKPNGGKASALNLGYAKARGDLILCVDADSRLSRTALQTLVARLDDPTVAAVAGQVTVRNRTSLLTRLQALEYTIGNAGLRAAMAHFGLVLVVPGPIGLYRRAALEAVARQIGPQGDHGSGPFSGATFAEDFQLSLSVLAQGGRIVYEPRAVSYTRAPDTADRLLSQRYRWTRGTFQVFSLYLRRLRRGGPRVTPLDLFTLLFCGLDLYVVPLVGLFFWASLGMVLVSGHENLDVLLWAALLAVLNITSALYCILAHEDDWRLVVLGPAIDLYQSVFLKAVWVYAALDEARGRRMSW